MKSLALSILIESFNSSAERFKRSTKELREEVKEEVKNRNTVESLEDLLSELPPSFNDFGIIHNKIEQLNKA